MVLPLFSWFIPSIPLFAFMLIMMQVTIYNYMSSVIVPTSVTFSCEILGSADRCQHFVRTKVNVN